MRQRLACGWIAALALAALAPAQGPAEGHFALRAGKVHLGDGRFLADAWIVVRDGKIVEVGNRSEPPPGVPVVDVRDKVVMPGIVAADSDLSGHRDAEYNVTPDFVALEGFDLVRKNRRALAGGVTTAYLAPGRSRLIPGQGSVVKTSGEEFSRRVLAETAALRITLGRESTQAPALFEPTPAPTSDDPLLPARKQVPTARISQLAELLRIFADARTSKADTAGPGAAEDEYAIEPLRRVLRKELPLRVHAKAGADLLRALELARRLEARLILEDPYEIGRVATQVAAAKAACVFRLPVRPGTTNAGGEDRFDRSVQSSPGNAARARAAGIPVAITTASDEDLEDFLLLAAYAVREGLSPEHAMAAITADAAAILGVDQRVGTIAPGKDADFLVLSGEPFAVGTLVEKTYVDGRLAYARESAQDVLAVRVGRILTGDGRSLRNGVLLAQGGRIKAIGEDLPIPFGARVIQLPEGTMTPGMIDAYTHVGLSGEGQGVPNGQADQRVADAVRPDDPLLAQAAEAGVTTVLVSGRDQALVSGRVAALKTHGTGRSHVLKEIAGVRFVFDGVGPDALRPLTEQIERGRRYIETWQQYEKSLVDPAASRPVVQAQDEARPDPITGTWDVDIRDLPIPFPLQLKMVLKLEGTRISGTVQVRIQGREAPPQQVSEGTLEGTTVRMLFRLGQGGDVTLEGTVGEDVMNGSFRGGPFPNGRFEARRTSKEAGGTAASGPRSNKPRVDEALEPIRALLEKRATAVVRAGRGPAIEAVVQWFEQQKLPYALHGAADAVDDPKLLGTTRPAVLLNPEVVERERGEIVNAAARLAEAGVPIAITSAATAGTRFLPLHASHAVRYGLAPEDALKAVTLWPARTFGLADRIGTLERGKDADFVVFSGNPLELTSRVLLVVIDGKVAVDRRTLEGGR
ncbi:MAG: amidohydrolase family protein [Planctomycetes bacterium]|nr:amidohydrolase family protein [Planctomycetota bacterium]